MANPALPPLAADDPRLLLLSELDNVFVAREDISAGEIILIGGMPVHLGKMIARGHKVGRYAIATGAKIMKYGVPIGSATAPIVPGEHVHVHNVKSDYTATHVINVDEGSKRQ